MAQPRDWRDPGVYAALTAWPAADLAWEFLRRDLGYAAAYRAALKSSPEHAPGHVPEPVDDVAGRWGLRFRGGPGPQRG